MTRLVPISVVVSCRQVPPRTVVFRGGGRVEGDGLRPGPSLGLFPDLSLFPTASVRSGGGGMVRVHTHVCVRACVRRVRSRAPSVLPDSQSSVFFASDSFRQT